MLLAGLIVIAVALTCTMVASKQAMLGFPCLIFWALTGGYCYQLSTATWDIYFITAFASLLGMGPFTAFGAFALREKRDTIADVEMDEESEEVDGYIDEKKNNPKKSITRADKLRERVEQRRSGERRPKRKLDL